MRAWLDMTARREAGLETSSKHIAKHRKDVARLYGLIPPSTRVELPDRIGDDARRFLDVALEDFDPKSIGVRSSVEEIHRTFKAIYGI